MVGILGGEVYIGERVLRSSHGRGWPQESFAEGGTAGYLRDNLRITLCVTDSGLGMFYNGENMRSFLQLSKSSQN